MSAGLATARAADHVDLDGFVARPRDRQRRGSRTGVLGLTAPEGLTGLDLLWCVRLTARVGLAALALAVIGVVGGFVLARHHGLQLDLVATGSMEPTVPAGSMVAMRAVEPAAIRPGDIVFYRRPDARDLVVMHRAIEVLPATTDRDGRVRPWLLRTQGDANRAPDLHPVSERDVLGVLAFHVPGVRSVTDAIKPPIGTALLALLPIALAQLASAGRPVRRDERDHRRPPARGRRSGRNAATTTDQGGTP